MPHNSALLQPNPLCSFMIAMNLELDLCSLVVVRLQSCYQEITLQQLGYAGRSRRLCLSIEYG